MVLVENFRKRPHWKEDKQKRRQGLSLTRKKNKNQSTRPETEQGVTVGQKGWEG